MLQITPTLYHAWKALEEVRLSLIKGDITALSNSHSHLVDERSLELHVGEVQPVLPSISCADSDLNFGCGPMATEISDSEAAKKDKKKQAKRRKKWTQQEAKWIRNYGTADQDSLVERFLCPLCPGLQKRYPRSTLLCHL